MAILNDRHKLDLHSESAILTSWPSENENENKNYTDCAKHNGDSDVYCVERPEFFVF